MIFLVLGLVLFLGVHSTRIVAEGWRNQQVSRLGEGAWKGLYSVASLAGFVLLVWGYGQTRIDPVVVWNPPVWTRHLAALLMLPSFVLLAAAYVPGNRIKAAVGHPMVLGAKVWAIAHLLSNGRLGDIVLFGAFLAWAVVDFSASRRRDRAAGRTYPVAGASRSIIVIAAGLIAYGVFAAVLHVRLIGVSPFG
jgi:uncharacterized membrane protein